MQSGAIEKLYFSIGLIDKLSGPSKGVAKSIHEIQKTARTGFLDIVKGGGAIGGVAFSMLRATGAARDFSKALGEVKSLDVSADELDKLGRASKQFTMRFGGDAAEVVRSAYDIQSAIPGLAKGALAAFTYQGALLAKAGKSNAATITRYTGTMYNIFEEDAKRIGQADWVEKLTGKTAYAIKMFKTTGDEMSAAFTNLGATGKVNNIGMDEQMAVLGVLQGTMGGANAGTAYKAFLNKIGQAGTALGVNFTDATGKALPMVDILDKIKAKIGPGGLKTADATRLMQAFGEEGGKAVMNLLGKVDQIKTATGDLSNVKNSAGAAKMAEAMTDPLERLTSIGKVLGITFGQIILPGLNMVIGALASMGMALVWLIDIFPPLRWAIGFATAGVVALTIAWGTMKITMGAMGLWNALLLKCRLVTVSLWKMNVISGTMTRTQKLAATANFLWSKSLGNAALWSNIATGAAWLFNAALWANPLTWVVIGIVALIGAVAALIYYWKDICSWFEVSYYWLADALPAAWNWIIDMFSSAWNWFKKVCPNIANLIEKLFGIWWDGIKGIYNFWSGIFVGIFNALASYFKWIWSLYSGFWDGVTGGIKEVYAWLSGKLIPVVQALGSLMGWLGGLGSMVWEGIKSVFSGIDGWIGKILGVLSKIPGLGFLDPEVNVDQTSNVERPVVPSVAASRKTDVPAGGVRNSSSKVNNWGGVTINTAAAIGPGEMEDLWGLQA